MNLSSAVVNTLWGATSLRAWSAYGTALGKPDETQRTLLWRYLVENAGTAVGRTYGFSTIRSVQEYQSRVPICGYEDVEPLISRIARGEPRVLTAAPVQRFVPTGGSTSATKLIPFTAMLRREFSVAIDAWLADLFSRHRMILGGPAYWSITPPASVATATSTVVPIGFEEDTSYLGGTRQALARAIMAVPPEVARVRDPNVFRYATVLMLLRARDLRLMSVWHPAFLTGLFDCFDQYRERLLEDLGAGTFNPPQAYDTADTAALRRSRTPQPARAKELRLAGGDVRSIWPKMTLISCWADGLAHGAAQRLATRACGVHVQAKGLLATEGIVTIPFAGSHPLAIRSHFFEFADDVGSVRLAHELEECREYTVVLTTGGGLYRYRLGDRVVVDGFVKRTPSLRFLGRDQLVSDRFGEKLTDGFVAGVLRTLFPGRTPPRFAMLAPIERSSGTSYTLFVDAEATSSPDLAQRLERALRQNVQYAWCVDVGQLAPAGVLPVHDDAPEAYLRACAARGQRLGDVKPLALSAWTGWAEILCRRHRPVTAAAC